MNAPRKVILGCQGPVWLAVFSLLFLTVPAQAQNSPDAGLVTKLSGEVTYRNAAEQKEPARAQAFMKVRRGDLFKLPGESLLQILYFANGRQETWKGPISIRAGEAESLPEEGAKIPSQPEVNILSPKVTKRMTGASLPLPRSSVRYSGVIQTMGPSKGTPPVARPKPSSEEVRREIQEAEIFYQDWRQQAPADDVTPDFYFLGVLADYQQYPEMEKIIDAMLAKRPGETYLKELKVWARSQSAATGQPAPAPAKK
jgi:hypothetical protein